MREQTACVCSFNDDTSSKNVERQIEKSPPGPRIMRPGDWSRILFSTAAAGWISRLSKTWSGWTIDLSLFFRLLRWAVYSGTQAKPADSNNRSEELMGAPFVETCPPNPSNHRSCHNLGNRSSMGTISSIQLWTESCFARRGM